MSLFGIFIVRSGSVIYRQTFFTTSKKKIINYIYSHPEQFLEMFGFTELVSYFRNNYEAVCADMNVSGGEVGPDPENHIRKVIIENSDVFKYLFKIFYKYKDVVAMMKHDSEICFFGTITNDKCCSKIFKNITPIPL